MNSQSHRIIISSLMFLAIMASCSVTFADVVPRRSSNCSWCFRFLNYNCVTKQDNPREDMVPSIEYEQCLKNKCSFERECEKIKPFPMPLCKRCFEEYDCDKKVMTSDPIVLSGDCKLVTPETCNFEEACVQNAIHEARKNGQFDRIRELAPQLQKCKNCFQYYNCDKKDWSFNLDNTVTEGWGCAGVSAFECNYEKTCAEQTPKKVDVPAKLPEPELKDIEPQSAPPADSVPAPSAANHVDPVPAPATANPESAPKTSCSANYQESNPLPLALILAAMLAFLSLLAVAFVHRKPNSQAGSKTDTMV